MSGYSNRQNGDLDYVDVYGRQVRVKKCKDSGEILIPLSEINQTGFNIYQREEYEKLSISNKQFTQEFDSYMLDAAASYILKSMHKFSEKQILKSINKCKEMLSGIKITSPPAENQFFNGRMFEQNGDDFKIRVTNVQQPPQQEKKEEFPKMRTLNENSPNTKVRHPKSDLLKKINPTELKEKEHEVIITCIDKKNCVWVRDKSNDELMNTIFNLVNDEEKKQKDSAKYLKMEKVYMAQDNGFWFRCKILRFSPLCVFFIDYGNVCQVTEVKEVSKYLAEIPCLAVRITFMESEYNPILKDEVRIKIKMQNNDGTYFVHIFKTKNVPPNKSIVSKKYFTIPQPLCTLQHGQSVIIIHEEKGMFYFRTLECVEKLNEIQEAIAEYVKTAPPIQNVDVDQLVLCKNVDDENFYRGVVTKVVTNKVAVKFLDICKDTEVDFHSLRNINEALSQEPLTYLGGFRLYGFDEVTEFSDDANGFILDMIEKKKKCLVILKEQNFDLLSSNEILSVKVRELENNSKKLTFKNMSFFKPEIGVNTYICGSYKSVDNFYLVLGSEIEKHTDIVMKTEMDESQPYSPLVGDVCRGYFTDSWLRCTITRTLNGDYEVFLLDFGSTELLKKEQLRKGDDKIMNLPALAIPCKMTNLPEHPCIEQLVTQIFRENEIYIAKIIKATQGKWEVEIPTVLQNIQNRM